MPLASCWVEALTFRELILISDVMTSHVSCSFGQNHLADVTPVHFDWLHGPVFPPGVKHHIAVDLSGETQ